MTNYEAISAELYPYDVDDALIEKVCIDNEVDSQATYLIDYKVKIAKIVIAILRNLIVLTGESNGGYSLSYSIDAIKSRIYFMAMENGFTDIAEEFNTRSSIVDISDIW